MMTHIAVFSLLVVCVVSEVPVVNVNCGCGNCQNDAVIFSVGRTTPYIPTTQSIIPMDHVFTNKGDHYNMVTNRFTAPFNGRYSFSFSAGSIIGKNVNLRLFAGNPEVWKAIAYDQGPNGNGASGSTILELKAGDTVSLQAFGTVFLQFGLLGGFPPRPPSTLFRGYLMQRDE